MEPHVVEETGEVKYVYREYVAGVEQRLITAEDFTPDMHAAAELALGGYRELTQMKPGVMRSKGFNNREYNAVRDLLSGLDVTRKATVFMVRQLDLDSPRKLREMGVPHLANMANVNRTSHGFIATVAPHKYMLVVNDAHRRSRHNSARRSNTIMHEVGHIVEAELLSRPEFADIKERLTAEHAKLLDKLKETRSEEFPGGRGAKQIDPFVDVVRRNQDFFTGEKATLSIRPDHFDYLTNFHEWFTEQFLKWSRAKTSPANTVVEKFFKNLGEMWTMLVEKFKGIAPTNPVFREAMREASGQFYTKLFSDHAPQALAALKERHGLTATEMELLGRPIYQKHYDPEFIGLLDSRLATWVGDGRTAPLTNVIGSARKQHKIMVSRMRIVARAPNMNARMKELDKIFFNIESYQKRKMPSKHTTFNERTQWRDVYGAMKDDYIKILRVVDDVLHGTYKDLTPQERLPRGSKQRKGKGVSSGAKLTQYLRNDGTWIDADTKKGQIKYYKTAKGAEAKINKLEEEGAGTIFEAVETKKGYRIKRSPLERATAARKYTDSEAHYERSQYQGGIALEATSRAQEKVAAWLQGSLKGQKRPRGGGLPRLREEIEKVVQAPKKRIIEEVPLRENGKFDNKTKKRMAFETEEAAKAVVDQHNDRYSEKAWVFKAKDETYTTKDGKKTKKWYVYRIYDEYQARVPYDPNTMDKNGLIQDPENTTRSDVEQVLIEQNHNMWDQDGTKPLSVQHMKDVGDRASARAFPLSGQKKVWVDNVSGERTFQTLLKDVNEVVDVFSGSGAMSTKARQLGFKGTLVENTYGESSFALKEYIRNNSVQFEKDVSKHLTRLNEMTVGEAKAYFASRPDNDMAALWIARTFQAQSREIDTAAGVSIRRDAFESNSRAINMMDEALEYSWADTTLSQREGWGMLAEAQKDSLYVVDPPYVGTNNHFEKGARKVTVDERLADLEKVFDAHDRGAKLLYFDKDPTIRQAFENRGFFIQDMANGEFMATNGMKGVPLSVQRSMDPETQAKVANEEIREGVQRGIDNDLLPEQITRQYDGAVEELKSIKTENIIEQFGKDLGEKNVHTFADLVDAVLKVASTNPTRVANLINIMPLKTQEAMRTTMQYVDDLYAQLEAIVGERNIKMEPTGDAVQRLIQQRVNYSKAAGESADLGVASTIVSRMEPGGVRQADVEGMSVFGKVFDKIERIYQGSLQGLQHIAEANPLIREPATALYQESGTQNKIYGDVTDQIHTRKPQDPFGDPNQEIDLTIDKKDRAYRKVMSNVEMSHAYDQVKLLGNVKSLDVGVMITSKDKDLINILKDFDETQKADILELVDRSQRAQTVLTQRRYQVMRDIDVVSAAKFLTRRSDGGLTSSESVGIIHKLEQMPDFQEKALLVSEEGGIDLKDAGRVVEFYDALANASFETYQFLITRPFYVSERLMKQFHVAYVYKGDKTTSRAAFDNLQEAEAFIKEAKKDGSKIIGNKVIDTHLQAGMQSDRHSPPGRDAWTWS
jgi:hypothetical protein